MTKSLVSLVSVCALRRAGHFRYFLIFSITTNYIFASFIKLTTYLLLQSYLKSPLSVKLTVRIAQNNILLLKKI